DIGKITGLPHQQDRRTVAWISTEVPAEWTGVVARLLTDAQPLDENKTAFEPAQNYTVTAVQHRVFSRSNIGVIFANRQTLSTINNSKLQWQSHDYNRVMGLEYIFASSDDKISGKAYQHFEFKSESSQPEYTRGLLLNHNTKLWRNWFHLSQISRNYAPHTGLVSRNDLFNANIYLAKSFYLKKGLINQIELLTNPQAYYNLKGEFTDYSNITGIHLISKSTHDIWVVNIRERNTLTSSFDPSFNNMTGLDSGYVSKFNYWRLAYGTDLRKQLSGKILIDYGGYYTGKQRRVEGSINYRFQPNLILGFNYSITNFKLPTPLGDNLITVFGPKVDLTLNRNLFWNNLIQYNSLFQNLNIFSRLQWRFRPLSDFFLIYSSYKNANLGDNHNLSLKIVYWL
ncbi:MAG TPA: hypothetical protein PKC30_16975, partial [Saprospiraceae bacterium]|nr:hypothetical protein [Saprospiraceae bacterium]